MPHLFVSILCLCDGLVIVVPHGYLASQALVHLRQSLRQDAKVVLDFLLLLLLLQNLLVQFISLATQVLNAYTM